PAFQHVELEPESKHDVEIVGDLVGVSTNERTLDFVDGAIERVERHGRELVGEALLQLGKIVLPETAAAPDDILPESRLAFMHAGRGGVAKGGAVERRAHTLLVHRVAGLVHGREQRVTEVVLAYTRRDADVAGGEAGAERMRRLVEPAAVEI